MQMLKILKNWWGPSVPLKYTVNVCPGTPKEDLGTTLGFQCGVYLDIDFEAI